MAKARRPSAIFSAHIQRMFPVRVVAILRPVSEREAQRLRVYLAASCDAVLLSWKHDRPGPAGLGENAVSSPRTIPREPPPPPETTAFLCPRPAASVSEH